MTDKPDGRLEPVVLAPGQIFIFKDGKTIQNVGPDPLILIMRLIILIFAIIAASAANAKPYSCSPNWPHTRAPKWAVELEKKHWSPDFSEAPAADDPIWQHFVCDNEKHTIDRSWDPEKEGDSGPDIKPVVPAKPITNSLENIVETWPVEDTFMINKLATGEAFASTLVFDPGDKASGFYPYKLGPLKNSVYPIYATAQCSKWDPITTTVPYCDIYFIWASAEDCRNANPHQVKVSGSYTYITTCAVKFRRNDHWHLYLVSKGNPLENDSY